MNYNDSILEAIDTLMNSKIKTLKFDSTIIAIISKVVSEYGKQYEIEYEGQKLIVYSLNDKYKIGDSVYIKIPQNDLSNRLYIEGLASNETENYQTAQSIVPIGQNITLYLNNETVDLTNLKDELTITEGYALLSMKIKVREGNVILRDTDYGLSFKRKDKKHSDEILFNTLDFEGNYFKFNNFFSQQTKIIKLSYDTVEEKILYDLNAFEEKIDGTRFYNNFPFEITDIKLQPIKFVNFSDIQFYSYIHADNSSQLKVMFYEHGINITNACNIKWYYKENAGDKAWTLFANKTTNFLKIEKEYYSIKAVGTYKENILEAFFGQHIYTLEDNLKCFVYNEEGKIANLYTEKEYLIGCNFDQKKEMIKWVYKDNDEEYILKLEESYTPNGNNSMLTNLWVDNNGQVHYKIQNNFKRNAIHNTLTACIYNLQGDELRQEKNYVFFVKEGDQGTNNSEYNILIKPCNDNGDIIEYFNNNEKEKYRIMVFQNGNFIEDFSESIEYFLEENKYGYENDAYETIFSKIGNFVDNKEGKPIYFVLNENKNFNDLTEEQQNFIHFSFKILNSVNKVLRYTLVRQKAIEQYPQYVLYSADGNVIDYVENNHVFSLKEENNPFFSKTENTSKEQIYSFWNEDLNYPVLKFRNIFSVNASEILINGMTLEEYIKSLITA